MNTDNITRTVPVSDKNFIGIGKLVFDSNADWNIPHLHFMVDKTASQNYEATLLEFGLVSWSETQDEAIKTLASLTHSYILAVMERAGFDQFILDVDDQVMDGYWRYYRKIEFTLAREGKDLSHEMDSHLVRAIKSMLSEETKNFIREIAKGNAEEVVAQLDKMMSLTPSTLTYTEIGHAA